MKISQDYGKLAQKYKAQWSLNNFEKANINFGAVLKSVHYFPVNSGNESILSLKIITKVKHGIICLIKFMQLTNAQALNLTEQEISERQNFV